MRLVGSYAKGFGCLDRRSMSFQSGLNVVLENNGWGKTTQAAFIKAMLYGLDPEGGDVERRRYAPWKGGGFGGYLDIELGESVYRISRDFGESAGEDSARLTLLSGPGREDISAEGLGESIFRLDSQAFIRSVFYTSIGRSYSGEGDRVYSAVDSAVSLARRDGLKEPQRLKLLQEELARREGVRSRLIEEKQRQCIKCERVMAEGRAALKRAAELEKSLGESAQRLEKAKGELEGLKEEDLRCEQAQRDLALTSERADKADQRVREILGELGGAVPRREELEKARADKRDTLVLREKTGELKALRDRLAGDLRAAEERFGGRLPTQEELSHIESVYSSLRSTEAVREELAAVREKAPEGYELIAAAARDDEDQVSRLRIMIGYREHLQQLIERHRERIRQEQEENLRWQESRREYEELCSKVRAAKRELQDVEEYRPEYVEPAIASLKMLRKEHDRTEQEGERLKEEYENEKQRHDRAADRYRQLAEQCESLKEKAAAESRFMQERVRETVGVLEELDRRQISLEMQREEIGQRELSEEERSFLSGLPEVLPGEEMLVFLEEQHRDLDRERRELKDIEIRLEGQSGKKAGLEMALEQLRAASGAEEGKDGARRSLAARVILNAADRLKAGKLKEDRRRIRELEVQLEKAKESEKELRARSEEKTAAAENKSRALAEKLAAFGAEPTEEGLKGLRELSQRAAELKKRQSTLKKAKQELDRAQRSIDEEMERTAGLYPELSGLGPREGLELLREGSAGFARAAERYKAARTELKNFSREHDIGEGGPEEKTWPALRDISRRMKINRETLENIGRERRTNEKLYPNIAGLDFDEAIAALRDGENRYRAAEENSRAAVSRQEHYVESSGLTQEQFALESSPRMKELGRLTRGAYIEMQQAFSEADDAFEPLGLMLTADNTPSVFTRAEKMLSEYQEYTERAGERERRLRELDRRAIDLKQELIDSSEVLGGLYSGMEVPDRLAAVRKDVREATVSKSRLEDAEGELKRQKNRLFLAEKDLAGFLLRFGGGSLEEIEGKTAEHISASREAARLRKERQLARAEAEKLRRARAGERAQRLAKEIEGQERHRQELMMELYAKQELIRHAGRESGEYPYIKREIGELMKDSVRDMEEQSVLDKTVELLEKARASLAGRYLRKAQELFNTYVSRWPGAGELKGELTGGRLRVEERGVGHSNFSAGSQSIIDICLRMALIDTLFTAERPFVILDDPFADLDPARLGTAMELLKRVAAEKQVIYFVCHPLRAPM